ncbi:uncharacterized protein LOC124534927 [Vanessa cardui]|uniref:uncharacterized protein LOC124534927 n=1 Tax=Vanessa cardui TaxID=171605 RepID=UPI001F13324A|nr:uncharacterized protein LOC124534927 [Vanessa cardui]
MLRSPHKDTKSSSQPDLANSTRIDSEPFVATRKRKERSELQDLRDEIHTLIATIKLGEETKFEKITKIIEELKEQNNSLKIQNTEILKSNDKIEKTLSHTTALYSDLKKSMEIMSENYNKAVTRIVFLEDQLEEIQRTQRATFIEINTPMKEKEDVLQMITQLHSFIGLKLPVDDIRQCYRVKTGNKNPIIVEYQDGHTRNKVLQMVRKFNKVSVDKINTSIFGEQDIKERIYVNESLTPKARKLHFLARQLKKSHGYRYNWISRGKIYVKKTDGDPAIQIKSLDQVEDLKLQRNM